MSQNLRQRLSSLEESGEQRRDWQVQLLQASEPTSRATLESICGLPGVGVVDTLEEQLVELMETRRPRPRPREVIEAEALAHRGETPLEAYGVWAFYTWSRRLVHVLPEAEFRELRTSRNRYKITAEEQARLGSVRVGIVGLSVGHATALTLALEGIGGELRLADFDTLSLSNLNRLRSGVHQLGLNKAVLCARDILELNPYARLRVFERGLDDSNIDAFLSGDGGLDLLIEECDDLYMKVLLRERARALKMPVLMETNDRGLIDIERFDLEPSRPLFHGLIPPVEARSLKGLAPAEKVPFVLGILDVDAASTRLLASLVEVERTVKTWPQLGSGVALGSALNADVARRIVLGQMKDSGRFTMDLETLIGDGISAVRTPVAAKPERADSGSPAPTTGSAAARPPPGPKAHAQALQIVEHALLAPSGGNNQPWRFELWGSKSLRCMLDEARAVTFLEYRHRSSYLALGAAAENAALTCEQLGLETSLRLLPRPDEAPTLAWELELPDTVTAPTRPPPLFSQIAARVTNRRLGQRVSLEPETIQGLSQAAESAGARLQLLQDGNALEALGSLLGAGERLRLLYPPTYRDMMAEIRWTEEEAERTRDGLWVETLELSPTDFAGLRVATRADALAVVREVGGGRALEESSEKLVRSASAMGLLTLRGPETTLSFLRGGRAMQRVWLTAQALGLAFQPMTALLFLFPRLRASGPGGDGLEARERSELAALRARFEAIFQTQVGEETELMLFRLARADGPGARSNRRAAENVLTFC